MHIIKRTAIETLRPIIHSRNSSSEILDLEIGLCFGCLTNTQRDELSICSIIAQANKKLESEDNRIAFGGCKWVMS